MTVSLTGRFRGAILGLAVGDALGAAVEFRPPGSFEPVVAMRGGGPFGLEAGYWTDDTSMALCLAQSLAECEEFDPADQMARYVRWYREGHLSSNGRCFDIGNTTAAALRKFEQTREPYSGSQCKHAAGNGSLMRLAPVPLFFWADAKRAVEYSGLSSRTTHGARAAVDACRYFGGLLWGAVQGKSKEELLAPCFEPYPGCWTDYPLCDEVLSVASGSFLQKEPPEIRGSGYSVESLEAALWAFARTSDFRSGVLAAVNLGDDADTTGAVFGQLGGAFYGADAIPPGWLLRLAKFDLVDTIARLLWEASPKAG